VIGGTVGDEERERETTGSHQTAETRLRELEGWRERVEGARSLGTFIAGGLGAIALMAAGAAVGTVVGAREELAGMRQQIASDERRIEALEDQGREDDGDRRDLAAALAGMREAVAGQTSAISALADRIARIEARLDRQGGR
jgi:hypothetical protein